VSKWWIEEMRRFLSFSILAFFAFLVAAPKIAFAEGGIVWGPAGKPVCTASKNQQNIRMVADGSGGAIIVWEDSRNGNADIYAQKIDKEGITKWGQYGVPVCTATMSQTGPVIVGDDYGGAIIAWQDYRNGNWDIYALRISSATGGAYSGWQPSGVPVSASTTETEQCPDIVAVGLQDVVVVWQQDTMSGNYSIRAQKMSGSGFSQWVGGVAVSTGTAPKENPKIINDGMGCVIVTWQDFRNNSDYDIYAQRIDINTGGIVGSWDSMGQPVSRVLGNQTGPEIVADGLGGAIIVWTDNRNSSTTGPDIYAQWISSAGVQMWESVIVSGDLNGIPICNMQGRQENPVIVSRIEVETIVGAIFAWKDGRDDPNGDIYATGIDLGVEQGWIGEDIPIAIGGQTQKYPRLVNDSQGGGIGAWIESSLLTSQWQIFATKRGQDGVLLWNTSPGVLVCQGSEIMDHQIVSDGFGGIIVAWQAIGASGSYDIFAQRVAEAPLKGYVSISGRVTHSDGSPITGVDVWALQGEKIISSCITGTNGYYGMTDLLPGTYLVRANWSANGIESSVSKEAFAPSYSFDFTLELDYELGTIAGSVSGVEREAKRVSASGFKNSLSPGNGTAFVELEQKGKIIVKVPLEMDGNYSIPNLLPGRFVARAYNGSIYSNSRTVNLKEGETLRVDFAFGIMPEETVFNYPNPAKDGSTTIRYNCGYSDPEAEIEIYNINGELVKKVKDSEIDKTDAPNYKFLWDCKNSSGKEVASSVYIYIVEVKEKSSGETKKVVKRMAIIR
jgi:beta propeller repeat protein